MSAITRADDLRRDAIGFTESQGLAVTLLDQVFAA